METFEKVLDIYNANSENFDLEFSFVGTGIAKIHKLTENKLIDKKKFFFKKNNFPQFSKNL